MTIIEIFRLVIGTIFLALGLMVFFIEIIGIYKMKYVLNRLHSAAMGDTMGIFLCIAGLCFYSGINFTTAKLLFALIVFWISSPVASHMTALLESYTNRRLEKHLTYNGNLENLEKRLEREKQQEK